MVSSGLQAKGRGISRREMLQLLGYCVGAGLIVGCRPTAQPTGPQEGSAVKGPVRGGVISTYADGIPGSFDMHRESSIRTAVPIGPCYNSLLLADEQDPAKVASDLAASWEIGDDGRTVTLKLVDGVRFHEGQLFTSDDAKFSLERVMTLRESPYKTWFASVEGIEAVDRLTLRLHLRYPDSSILLALASPWVAMYSKTWVEAGNDPKTKVNGTGPFKLVEYVQGSHYRLVRNPDYFRKGRPYVDAYEIFFMDQEAQLPNLISRRIIWSGPASKAVDTPSKQEQVRRAVPGIVIEPYDGMSGSRVIYNLKVKPFDDVRIRRALDLAIDRENANKTLYEGAGTVMGPVSIPSYALPMDELKGYLGYRPNPDANLTEAKRLLAEAGISSGLRVPLVTFEVTHTVNTAVYVKSQWEKIGVVADVQVMDLPSFNARLSKGDFVTAVDSIAERLPDPVGILAKYVKGDPMNYGSIDDPVLNQLYANLRRETEFDRRVTISRDMQRRIIDQAYDSVVVGRPSWQAWWPELKGYRVGIGHYHTYIRMEQVWLEKA